MVAKCLFGLAFVLAVSVGCMCLADELGSVRLLTNDKWVAGSLEKFEVEFTAGSGGIPLGGGVGVSFLHALTFNMGVNPSGPNYVKVIRESGEVLQAEVVQWLPNIVQREYPNGSSYIVHHSVVAKVTDSPIKAGEKILFVFGANDKGFKFPTDACENPFRIVVNSKGDNNYYVIEDFPKVHIIGGPLDHFFVTIPATRTVGGKADICIRGEDKMLNLSPDCNIEVTLSGIPGLPATPVKLKAGLGRTEAPVTKPGVYRVTVKGGGVSANSNPMVVTNKPPHYNIYWGDMHVHTIFSDGCGGDAEYCYTYARDASDLDVCALGDHAPRQQSRAATRKYNDPGRFVTIWGYEWAESVPGRLDRNLYFHNEDDPLPEGWPKTTEGLWKALEAVYGDNKDRHVIVGPHMFTYKTKSRPWYESWNDHFDRFIEIYSEHGMSEYKGNPRMLASGDVQDGFFAQDGLKSGRRFGIIGSSDNHTGRPGRSNAVHPGGIVAFLAKDLTRESIWDAWVNRRVYAATAERVYIDFKIDGHVLGEEFMTSGKPKISYTVHSADDKLDVYLIKNNTELKKTSTTNGTVKESFADDSFDSSSYYYLRVVQADGEWAWSSPIWVDKP